MTTVVPINKEEVALHRELVAELRRTYCFLEQQVEIAMLRPQTTYQQISWLLDGIAATADLLHILGEEP